MSGRFTPWARVSSVYGAPMGRASTPLDPALDPAALAVAGPVGEYDPGGAYWGLGFKDGPVWAVWERGKGREGVCYVRARSREGAKIAALSDG
jgi:hypothetical protein